VVSDSSVICRSSSRWIWATAKCRLKLS